MSKSSLLQQNLIILNVFITLKVFQVRSGLNCRDIIWHAWLLQQPLYLKLKTVEWLQTVQNSAVRLITRAKGRNGVCYSNWTSLVFLSLYISI